jgi:hypothetical protein
VNLTFPPVQCDAAVNYIEPGILRTTRARSTSHGKGRIFRRCAGLKAPATLYIPAQESSFCGYITFIYSAISSTWCCSCNGGTLVPPRAFACCPMQWLCESGGRNTVDILLKKQALTRLNFTYMRAGGRLTMSFSTWFHRQALPPI